MLIQKKPNRCSCLVTAFAMATNQDVGRLIGLIGHDGMRKVNDGAEPTCYRGHHIQEIIDALASINLAVTEIQAIPSFNDGEELKLHYSTTYEARLQNYINNSSGVIVGRKPGMWRHAFANERGNTFNPDTGESMELPTDFSIEVYYKVDPIYGEITTAH